MGTITERKRKDGTMGFTAQIRIKQNGKVVHTESQTFDRKPAAANWLKKRELELAAPGALDKLSAKDPTLKEVIAQYLEELRKEPGKTKKQVLNTICEAPIAQLKCSEIGSKEIMSFANSLNVQPQTVGNYLAHLGTVFKVAKPAWGYPLDFTALQDARIVGKKMGVTGRSEERDRRPTLDELDKLLEHYDIKATKRQQEIPMQDLILFALFSSRRQEEITRLAWEGLDEAHHEIIVRDMKHPGEKIGNDVRVSLPPEALAVIKWQSKPKEGKGTIFPYEAKSISASFTRACQFLGIENLHFHDLRHEGVSRLFEMGWTIPQVATVSGHRTWQSLKRYAHIRKSGDKYDKWDRNPLSRTYIQLSHSEG